MTGLDSPGPAILKVAVDCPLRSLLDYLPPAGAAPEHFPSGARVRVSLGRASAIGVIVGHAEHSSLAPERLRPVRELLDAVPLFGPELVDLLQWTASYYHHAPGEVFAAALPAALRAGQPLHAQETWLLPTAEGRAALTDQALRRAPKQRELLLLLATRPLGWNGAELDAARPGWRVAAHALERRGWLEFAQREAAADTGAIFGAPLRAGTGGDATIERRAGRGGRQRRCGRRALRQLPAAGRHRQRQDRGVPAAGASEPSSAGAVRWCWCPRSASRHNCWSASARAWPCPSRCCTRR